MADATRDSKTVPSLAEESYMAFVLQGRISSVLSSYEAQSIAENGCQAEGNVLGFVGLRLLSRALHGILASDCIRTPGHRPSVGSEILSG